MRVHIETGDLDAIFKRIEVETRAALEDGDRFCFKVSPSVIIDGLYVLSGYTEAPNDDLEYI